MPRYKNTIMSFVCASMLLSSLSISLSYASAPCSTSSGAFQYNAGAPNFFTQYWNQVTATSASWAAKITLLTGLTSIVTGGLWYQFRYKPQRKKKRQNHQLKKEAEKMELEGIRKTLHQLQVGQSLTNETLDVVVNDTASLKRSVKSISHKADRIQNGIEELKCQRFPILPNEMRMNQLPPTHRNAIRPSHSSTSSASFSDHHEKTRYQHLDHSCYSSDSSINSD